MEAVIERVLAIDPGAVNHGVAVLSYNRETKVANLHFKKTLRGDEGLKFIVETLRTTKDLWVVIEDFKHAHANGNFRGKQTKAMGKNEYKAYVTAKKLKEIASLSGHKVVTQEPSILGMARRWYKWEGKKLPQGHIRDDRSAFIHGVYFMMRKSWISTINDVHNKGAQQNGFEGMGSPSDNESGHVQEGDFLPDQGDESSGGN